MDEKQSQDSQLESISKSIKSSKTKNETSSLIYEKESESQRLNSSSQLTTEIVFQLFGHSVGSVISDHSCSYQRKSGRLYIGQNAACFYSNLFGFEHHFMIQWSQVQEIKLGKTTSICILAMGHYDEETKTIQSNVDEDSSLVQHIFKGFTNRDEAMTIMQNLHEGSLPKTVRSNKSALKRKEGSLSNEKETDLSHFNDKSIEKIRGLETNDQSVPENNQTNREKSDISSNVENGSPTKQTTKSLGDLWLQMMNCTDTSFKEIALNQFQLDCSIQTFFENFLSDNAPFSHEFHHIKNIRDSNVETSLWQKYPSESLPTKLKASKPSPTQDYILGECKDLLQFRTIKFHHKIKTPIGKSIARGVKYQTLHTFPENKGIILDCKIDCVGVHASDCFYVEERWIIEAVPGKKNVKDDCVLLTTKFEVRFVKNSLWKGVIERMTNAETKNWFENYGSMMKENIMGIHQNGKKELEADKKALIVLDESIPFWRSSFSKSTFLFVFVAIFCCFFALYCVQVFVDVMNEFDLKVKSLQNELDSLRSHMTDIEQKMRDYEVDIQVCNEKASVLNEYAL